MIHWLETNFPPDTLPLFLSIFITLIVLNIITWHYNNKRRK